MSFQAMIYNVMLSCPSDIKDEKDIVQKVLRKYNNLHSEKNKIVLLPIMWESDSIPIQGDHPQNIINKTVLNKSDLLIAIFWTRLGTPTNKALSGSVEEIEKHISLGKPTLLYLSKSHIDLKIFDNEQYSKLLQFIKNNKDKGLYQEYENLHDFEESLYNNIVHLINSNDYFTKINNENKLLHINNSENNKNDNIITKLTDESKYLLKEASLGDGTIIYIVYAQGIAIRVKNETFQPENVREKAKYDEAIKLLQSLKLIESQGDEGIKYTMTAEGFRIADKLHELN